MDARQWNGEPEREHDPGSVERRAPTPYVCLDCFWRGRGQVPHNEHWQATKHRIVWAGDPRAKDAPRESVDPDPAPHCLAHDGEGRR